MPRIVRRLIFTLLAFLTACDDTSAPATQTLEPVSGQDQAGASGFALAQPIVVRLSDAGGRAIRNALVRWRALDGGGSVNNFATPTDADGRAEVEWTLGSATGRQTLLASSGSADLLIQAKSTLRVVSVAAGFRHTCALVSSRVAYCWGDNTQGQLGNGTQISSAAPVRVGGKLRFKALTAAWSHTCGITTIGEALCWGDNSVGQAGIGVIRSASAAPVAGTDAFSDIVAGFVHTCAVVVAGGDAVCWGSNAQGQLSGAQPDRSRIAGLQLTQISAGEFHSCALRADNSALCWGWNTSGELGIGGAGSAVVNAPTPVSGGVQFTRIAAGVRHTCALALNGRAWCWGRNAVGETGQDPFVTVNVPTEVPGGQSFSSIGTGNTHTCGLSNGSALCWGSSPANGAAAATKVPAVVGNLQFSAIAVGFDHTCGVSDGAVWCWGNNSHGQLGQTGIGQSASPMRVALPAD